MARLQPGTRATHQFLTTSMYSATTYKREILFACARNVHAPPAESNYRLRIQRQNDLPLSRVVHKERNGVRPRLHIRDKTLNKGAAAASWGQRFEKKKRRLVVVRASRRKRWHRAEVGTLIKVLSTVCSPLQAFPFSTPFSRLYIYTL